MKSLIILIVIFAALFLLVFLTKRRFGILALALCAGSLLSSGWTETLTPIIQQQGISLVAPPLAAVVAVILLLLPAILVLFSGTVSKGILRVLSAVCFALMALTMMLDSLAAALIFDGVGQKVYLALVDYGNYVIVLGIILAVIDVILSRTSIQHSKKDK